MRVSPKALGREERERIRVRPRGTSDAGRKRKATRSQEHRTCPSSPKASPAANRARLSHNQPGAFLPHLSRASPPGPDRGKQATTRHSGHSTTTRPESHTPPGSTTGRSFFLPAEHRSLLAMGELTAHLECGAARQGTAEADKFTLGSLHHRRDLLQREETTNAVGCSLTVAYLFVTVPHRALSHSVRF